MMNYGKLFASVVATLAICTEVFGSEHDECQQLAAQQVDPQGQVMEGHQGGLDALDYAETASFDQIWKQRKHFTLSIGSQKLDNLDEKDEPALKSSIALSAQMGKTFNLHKKPLADIIKIGLDWNSVELHFAKYKNFDIEDNEEENSGSGDHLLSGSLDDVGLSNLGFYQLDYGMAVGPSVQVTPFYTIGKGLEYIKAYTYFHVIPSYSIIFLSSSNDTNLGYGYVTNFSWGIGISWRSLAIGFETRWGSGKYNTSAFDNNINEETVMDGLGSFLQNDKTKYKTTSSKFTISLRW